MYEHAASVSERVATEPTVVIRDQGNTWARLFDPDREEVSAAPRASLGDHTLNEHRAFVTFVDGTAQQVLVEDERLATTQRRGI
jgi:hypothetical protein